MNSQMGDKTGKRRSFIDVQRKSILFDQLFDEGNENSSSNENTNITVTQYLASLKEERLQWKEILELRRKQLEERHKNFSTCESNEMRADEVEQFLDEEDKNFLNDEPDYLGMLECADRYLKSVDFVKRYKLDIIEHYEQIIEEAEMQNNELVENICREDMCELCNKINCNNPDHKQCLMG